MITEVRKKKISKLTGELAQLFSSGNITQLEELATAEDLPVYYDDYEEAFDGMLLYDNKDFHIHINHTKGNQPNSKRGRFTLAHELGHYFIDEHRLGLKSGSLKPHGSLTELKDKDLIELEADYFASCLLMPESKFKPRSGLTKKFSLATITDLSHSFQASIVSTVIRFSEVGTHEIMAVFSRNNIVEWYARCKDFPQWPFRFKVHGTLPPTTVAGEFYTKNSKYTGIEKVGADDWFFPFENDERADRQMYEQCYYSKSYDYVISLIWFD
jgi:Zn-dependent peptidase ImmA (M78 family)